MSWLHILTPCPTFNTTGLTMKIPAACLNHGEMNCSQKIKTCNCIFQNWMKVVAETFSHGRVFYTSKSMAADDIVTQRERVLATNALV